MPAFSHIPTSFVPLPPQSAPKRRWRLDFAGALSFVAFGIFILSSLAALSVFLFQMYLQHNLARVQQNIQTAQQSFNVTPIQKMTNLNDRIIASQKLLNTHITLSRFLDSLSTNTPKNVRFTFLGITVNPKKETAFVKASGVARDFNALVVESQTFEKDKNLSNVVFSNISVNGRTGSINFVVSAIASKNLIGNFSAMVNGTGIGTTTTSESIVSTTTAQLQHTATTTP